MIRLKFIHIVLLGTLMLGGHCIGQSTQEQIEVLREEVSALREQLAAVEANATTIGVLVVNSYLAAGQFHAMDDALAAGEFDPRFLATVEDTLTVVEVALWPGELEEGAAEFAAHLVELEGALREEDMEAAAEAAARVHDSQHELSHAIFGYAAESHGTRAAAVPIPEGAVELNLELAEHGGAAGGATTHAVSRGDTVAVVVRSTASGELHLHGYDLAWEVDSAEELVATFAAEATGRFPMEFHPADDPRGVVVGYLEVRP